MDCGAAPVDRAGPQVTMLTPQGITLALRTSQGKVTDLAVHSSRTGAVASLAVGTAPAMATSRIGLAFALCRIAQRTACENALSAAGAPPASTQSPPELARNLEGELLREHACNLFLSWPRAVGDEAQPALVRALQTQGADDAVSRRAVRFLLSRDVLGMDPVSWLGLNADGLLGWCAHAATPTALRLRRWIGATAQARTTGFLPSVAHWHEDTAHAIDADLRVDPGFGLYPLWQGKPAQTGAIARVREHSLAHAWFAISGNDAGARMLARVIELAQWACEPALPALGLVKSWSTGPGCGLSAVETSRGVLVHRVRLVDGCVADYSIVAPTEWNFHPGGLLRQVLLGGLSEDVGEFQARAWLIALDPCVDCSVAKFVT